MECKYQSHCTERLQRWSHLLFHDNRIWLVVSPSFSGLFGGALTVTATCSASGYQSASVTKTAQIKGTQPSDTLIAAQMGSLSSPFSSADLRRIGCVESNLTQFAATGLPLYGGGGDTGIMQICFQRTNQHLWNWRANIDAGRAILSTAQGSAQNHLDGEVSQGATAYATQMWREESLHRYNAGTGAGNEYREWSSTQLIWVVVDRGGVGGYVPAVLAKSATCT